MNSSTAVARKKRTPRQASRAGVLQRVPRERLFRDRFDLRIAPVPEADRQRLAASIAQHGQAQPLTAVPVGDRLEIVTGSLRWRAVPEGAWLDVLVLPADTPEADLWRLSFAENQHRRDLTFVERTFSFLYTFDSVGCSRCPAYAQVSSTRDERLRWFRNQLLNTAKSGCQANELKGLVDELLTLHEELMASAPRLVSPKTLWPSHLRVLDLPPEILPGIADLNQSTVLKIAAAFSRTEGEARRRLVEELKQRAANGELTPAYAASLNPDARTRRRSRSGRSLRFDSAVPVDDRTGLLHSRNHWFLFLRLSLDQAEDRRLAAEAVPKAYAALASAGARETETPTAIVSVTQPGAG